MRDNVILWWVLTAFFALVGVVYTGWHILATPSDNFAERIEWVGTVAPVSYTHLRAHRD